MIRIHQAARRRHNAVPIGIRIIAERDVELILPPDQRSHRVRARTIHPDHSVMVHRHKTERRIHLLIQHRHRQAIVLGDARPIVHRRAAQRIDAHA